MYTIMKKSYGDIYMVVNENGDELFDFTEELKQNLNTGEVEAKVTFRANYEFELFCMLPSRRFVFKKK